MENIKLNFEALETEEEKNKAIEVLTVGIQSQFWKYLKNVLEYNIDTIAKKILSEVNMTEDDNKIYKMYLQALKDLKQSPQKHLAVLNCVEKNEEDNPDPHY